MSLAALRTENALSTSPTSSRRWNGSGWISSFPASTFEKSRISSRIVNNDSADPYAVARNPFCSSVSSVSRARPVIPMMPFIGVRISWLIFARKALFARVASSAASCRSAILLISATPCRHDCIRNMSSKTTHPVCSNQRYRPALITPNTDSGQYTPRRKWSRATTVDAVTSTFQSR